jgi:transcriptional regulator with XRE-family HTH domain
MNLGLLQREVAEKLSADQTSVWNWERNRNQPELRFMPSILAFLGYDPRPEVQSTGERLVRHRTRLGWSQKQLAAVLKLDPTTLSRWELGKKAPWGIYALRIKNLIGASV